MSVNPEDCDHLPTTEVVQDRKDAIKDIFKCYIALKEGIMTLEGIDTVFRLNANINQIKVIDAILIYRNWEGPLPCL